MCCPVGAASSASAPRGTSGSTAASACRSRRWPSGSSGWRRRCGSAGRCGTRTNNGAFEGKHYQLAETLCAPQPISKPPILIGGGGEKKTLRLVAHYADACNLFASSPEEVGRKLGVLRGHCDEVGRDYSTIRKTVLVNRSPAEVGSFVADMAPYAKLGVDTTIVMPPGDAPARWIDDVGAPIAARLADL